MQQISGATYTKLLFGLGLSLALLFVYQLFGGTHSTDEPMVEHDRRIPVGALATESDKSAQPDSSIDQAIQTLVELRTESLTSEKPAVSHIGRNLFSNAPVATAPLPSARVNKIGKFDTLSSSIELVSIAPAAIYAQAEGLRLVVHGVKFNPEMKIYINGSADKFMTAFVSPQELQADLPANLLALPQSLRIEVKEPGNEARLFSNALSLRVTPLPFAFTGKISESGGRNPRVILSNDKERFSAAIGELVQGRWRVLDIVGDYLELEDTEQGSRHRLKEGETPQPDRQAVQTVTNGEPSNREPSSRNSSSPTSIDPNFFTRPERPMTYQELLQRRAEAAHQKRK